MSSTYKLYIAPGACSFAPHLLLREAGLDFELEAVDLRSHKTREGVDFYTINPKGYVPALVLPTGELLTEVGVILNYIAAQSDKGLVAPYGTLAYFRSLEDLNYIATELHKSFVPLFKPNATDEQRAQARERIVANFALFAKRLETQPYLAGEDFSIADAYLFTIQSWTRWVGVDLSVYPSLVAYAERVGARPSVVASLAAEREFKKA